MNRKRSILKTFFLSFLAPFSSLFLFRDTLSLDKVFFLNLLITKEIKKSFDSLKIETRREKNGKNDFKCQRQTKK